MYSKQEIENPFGGSVWYKERTGSTMDDARSFVLQGEKPGSIAWAGAQEAGRGRFADRKWESPPGESLLFTLALFEPTHGDSFPLSLRVSLALAYFLEFQKLPVQVKWPNDVLVNERKISGILIIGGGNWKYTGIGLNVAQKLFPQNNLRRPATSLYIEGIETTTRAVLENLLPFVFEAISMDGANARSELEQRLWHKGRNTDIVEHPDKPPRRGEIIGLDTDGALLLATRDGTIRCVSGE